MIHLLKMSHSNTYCNSDLIMIHLLRNHLYSTKHKNAHDCTFMRMHGYAPHADRYHRHQLHNMAWINSAGQVPHERQVAKGQANVRYPFKNSTGIGAGHHQDNQLNSPWVHLLRTDGETIVVRGDGIPAAARVFLVSSACLCLHLCHASALK
jgi:hypothetical protein